MSIVSMHQTLEGQEYYCEDAAAEHVHFIKSLQPDELAAFYAEANPLFLALDAALDAYAMQHPDLSTRAVVGAVWNLFARVGRVQETAIENEQFEAAFPVTEKDAASDGCPASDDEPF
jgi:hypothetical protein